MVYNQDEVEKDYTEKEMLILMEKGVEKMSEENNDKRKVLIAEEVIIKEDNREENLIKDSEGKVISHKQSQFVCHFNFTDKYGSKYFFPINFPELFKALELINKNEDFKYPNGLGRKMLFYAYIYPMYKNILEENKFVPNWGDLGFSKEQARKIDSNYDKFLETIKNGN